MKPTTDIIIGANLGDEGKGTVTATITKNADGKVLNILTNGGSQRGHSILTENGSFTFCHFGSGTYHGADNYYSEYFIINPMSFVKEYNELKRRGICLDNKVHCSPMVRWSSPYDMMANQIIEELRGETKHGSCGMGIWETVRRYVKSEKTAYTFKEFMSSPLPIKLGVLMGIKSYFEELIGEIPSTWKHIWNSSVLVDHFIEDCKFMHNIIDYNVNPNIYNRVIFENGQGLMLCDTGKDIAGTTPSMTDSSYALRIAKKMGLNDITLHYVTRPYLTRHGKGYLDKEIKRGTISSSIEMDRTNHYNIFQDDFRYAPLDITQLKERIKKDNRHNLKYKIDLTHCDEMDREKEFKDIFKDVVLYDNALI